MERSLCLTALHFCVGFTNDYFPAILHINNSIKLLYFVQVCVNVKLKVVNTKIHSWPICMLFCLPNIYYI